MTEVIAHRGNRSYFPENTLPAFLSAIELGVDGIELDVHLSKDDELIVMHDEKIDRTTDSTGFIRDYTLDELKAFDAGSWYDEQVKGTKIPTLSEVINLLNVNDFHGLLNIEVKTDNIEYPAIEAILAEKMKKTRLKFSYMYSSFNLETLKRIALFDSEAKRGYILGTSEKKVKSALKLDFLEAIHPKIDWVMANLTKIEDFPLPIRTWTVNDEGQMRLVYRNHLSALMTDYPELALQLRSEMDVLPDE
ncbi:MAG: glycerophosphodiester phosphodiesterase [Streptococcaceae bacterium]|jgi:glycerophosphoryl diester phosphodiesterase|nr:glycerophosphodiester phosphodiesterase [Streptococcaceae bacterium]